MEELYRENIDPIRGPFQMLDPTKEYNPEVWTAQMENEDEDDEYGPNQWDAYHADYQRGESQFVHELD